MYPFLEVFDGLFETGVSVEGWIGFEEYFRFRAGDFDEFYIGYSFITFRNCDSVSCVIAARKALISLLRPVSET